MTIISQKLKRDIDVSLMTDAELEEIYNESEKSLEHE